MTKPRQTKTDKVRKMLMRPQGARLEAICKATGWQPHSARAALSGMRKAGYVIVRTSAEDGKRSATVYRITDTTGASE